MIDVPGHLIDLVLVLCPLMFGGCTHRAKWMLIAWLRFCLYNGGVDEGGYAYYEREWPLKPWYFPPLSSPEMVHTIPFFLQSILSLWFGLYMLAWLLEIEPWSCSCSIYTMSRGASLQEPQRSWNLVLEESDKWSLKEFGETQLSSIE